MLNSMIQRFYSLTIPQAVLLIGLATVCFLKLDMRYGAYGLWRKAVWLSSMVWVCIVIAVTVRERSGHAVPLTPMLIPFHSYIAVIRGETSEILRSNFMNVVLFYPAGLMISPGLPHRWKQCQRLLLMALLGIAVSTGIEFLQYYYCLGVPEIDDVIHNTLGAVVGALPHFLAKQFLKHQ